MRDAPRYALAFLLMMGLIWSTNRMFGPPIAPPPPTAAVDSTGAGGTESIGGVGAAGVVAAEGEATADPDPTVGGGGGAEDATEAADSTAAADVEPAAPRRSIVVETPLLELRFSNYGAILESARVRGFDSFTRDGPVELVSDLSTQMLGSWIVSGADTVDLRGMVFEVEPADGLTLGEGDAPRTLTFTAVDPDRGFAFRVEYEFAPDRYSVPVRGAVQGVANGAVYTDLGAGLAFNEHRDEDEAQAMAYAWNHVDRGIGSENLPKVEERVASDGPYTWAATRSKYFVAAILAGDGSEGDGASPHLGAVVATPVPGTERAAVSVSEPIRAGGTFAHRIYLGPQDFNLLATYDMGLERVNSYGGRIFRPIVQPFVAIVLWVMQKLHQWTALSYGWVLIIIGVGMRVVLFPLNQKAMRAQLRNMAVQPLLKEVQSKYKDQPEKLQKEMMKLYKDHGFNPLAGCLPMLIPWPVLIALFFVFQNTIELRGEQFWWLDDLSIPDPFYILPVFLGISMFLMQWVSYRSLDEPNPQMKMMMYLMPPFMTFIFLQFAAGLNLYYATTNVAMIPQQWWIARERQRARASAPPLRLSDDSEPAEKGGKGGGRRGAGK